MYPGGSEMRQTLDSEIHYVNRHDYIVEENITQSGIECFMVDPDDDQNACE